MKISHLIIISIFIILGVYFGRMLFNFDGEPISKNFDSETFTGVSNKIGANIYLTQKEEQSIEITANENALKNLSLKVKDGILIIDSKKFKFHFDSVSIRISIPKLTSLQINGSGNISTSTFFDSCGSLKLQVNGSGNIDAFVNSDATVTSEINGSGNIYLKGKSVEFNSEIQGSGNINAFDLRVNHSTVDINGSGNCEVTADSTLNVIIRGSGNIYYKGFPVLNSKVSGSGEIHDSN